MKTAVITGASSGLGLCIGQCLMDSDAIKIEGEEWDVANWSLPSVDVRSSESIQFAIKCLPEWYKKVDVLINCAGINAIEFIPKLEEAEFDRIMDTNAKALFLTSQALLERLRGGTIINIVSNAAHIPMTSSLAYNASKGAALIMTKQMNRELKKTHDITVFSISPNKMKGTGMSRYIDNKVCELRGWTPEEAEAYQLASLPAGEETDPMEVAEFIAYLLSTKQRHKYLAGCDIPYGA